MAEIVSSFELIYKAQSPLDADGAAPADVLQGYFLSISNLEEEDYEFALRFVISPVSDETRDLEGPGGTDEFNTNVIIDTPSGDNSFTTLTTNDGKTFFPASGAFTIPAHGTALVVVLPQAFAPVGTDVTLITPANPLEVRGYVEIRLPTVFTTVSFGERPLAFQTAQSDEPVRVLVTPQYRASYISDGAITDQTQSTVPTATGAGVISVEPDEPFRITPELRPLPLSRSRRLGTMIDSLSAEARSDLLSALLAQADAPEDVDGFNKSLAEAGGRLRIQKGG